MVFTNLVCEHCGLSCECGYEHGWGVEMFDVLKSVVKSGSGKKRIHKHGDERLRADEIAEVLNQVLRMQKVVLFEEDGCSTNRIRKAGVMGKSVVLYVMKEKSKAETTKPVESAMEVEHTIMGTSTDEILKSGI